MKRAAFYTLGCKVNLYDTEAVSKLFRDSGYEIVDFDEVADIYVINTCTVTHLGDRKSRQMISRAKKRNPNAVIAVIGCYAQTAPDEVARIPGVDLILGTRDRSRIVSLAEEAAQSKTPINAVRNVMEKQEFEEMQTVFHEGRTRAVVKIQDGCSQFCSYCIIPYARGPIRSRRPENVIREVEELAQSGFKEVVLTGIHLASYGRDLNTISLIDLITYLHSIDGLHRIRLGSLEPNILTGEFVERLSKLPKVCSHFHVSLQSGCDETLKRMNRKYTTREYKKRIELLRSAIPDVAVTTDVMVGFPGETEQEFEETYRFVEKIAFSQLHVFKYSPRKGTPAAGFPNQVAPEVKEVRSNKLIELSNRLHAGFLDKFEGRIMDIILEQEAKECPGYMEGLTSNYIRVIIPRGNSEHGELVTVKLSRPEGTENADWMTGSVISK